MESLSWMSVGLDDADTTAAICGQMAGAVYGEANIPVKWLERLFMRVEIRNVAVNWQDFYLEKEENVV